MKMRYLAVLPILAVLLAPLSSAQVPVFKFDKAKSEIGFNVKASVPISGKFDKWDATMIFTSPDVKTGVLHSLYRIHANERFVFHNQNKRHCVQLQLSTQWGNGNLQPLVPGERRNVPEGRNPLL